MNYPQQADGYRNIAIYVHGHSTGGPFAMMAAQRVANIVGVIGYGTSPFGYMYPQVSGDNWEFPFNQLRLRTWRDTARYLYEGMKDKGIGLPMLIELTFERWDKTKRRPNFKAEDLVHKNSLTAPGGGRSRRRGAVENVA